MKEQAKLLFKGCYSPTEAKDKREEDPDSLQLAN